MLTSALTVTGAANVATVLTVKVCTPDVPSTVLPATVRVLLGLVILTPPAKVDSPVLSIMRRLLSWPEGLRLLVPAVLVLKIRLPPQLPVLSCTPPTNSNMSCAPHGRECR